jgi:hypothetical protein
MPANIKKQKDNLLVLNEIEKSERPKGRGRKNDTVPFTQGRSSLTPGISPRFNGGFFCPNYGYHNSAGSGEIAAQYKPKGRPPIFHIPKSVKCRIPTYSRWIFLREGHDIESKSGQYLGSGEVIGRADNETVH